MPTRRPLYVFLLSALFACSALLVTACGPQGPAAEADSAAADGAATAPAPPAPVEPYRYPPPVSGHYSEINTGDFDLVDGIAWVHPGGTGTTVYVTSKPIASPILGATCPVTEARALTLLRNAAWNEVTISPAGKAPFYGAGTPFDGTGRETDVGGRYWKIALDESAPGTIAGKVTHKERGSFTFELPVRTPAVPEKSESDRMDGFLTIPDAATPEVDALVATFRQVRAAALAKDLPAFLSAQGFDAKQIAAIRGLDGIDDEFSNLSLNFLIADEVEEPAGNPGYGVVSSHASNAEGKPFANYYFFAPCGERLVLIMIGVNPQ